MKLQPYDFTCLAAAKRLYPLASVDPASVEGRYCAVRKCPPQAKSPRSEVGNCSRLKLFADRAQAQQWAEQCPCGSANQEDHLVTVVEPLQPPELAAFRGREDWTNHHAAELLQKWAVIVQRLAHGPATRVELDNILAGTVASGKAGWMDGDPLAHPSDCMPTLQWAYSHDMVNVEYRDDLSTIEFTI